jgi:hypothetical protein
VAVHLILDEFVPETGLRMRTYYDDDVDGVFTVDTQDAEGLLEVAKASMAQTDERARWGDTPTDPRNQIAFIPDVIWVDLYRRGIVRDKKAFKRWLNDPENRAFKTRPGRV